MPLAPIPLLPAFRFGADTPWGGTRLSTFYHKDAPEGPVGESLEMSAIPGLNSKDPDGTPLSELARRFGKDLMGAYAKEPFPLLLKLLDARDRLSVQVHPDDGYARREGKAGKAEAWVILHADPGAGIVCGVKPGVTRDRLKEASGQGAALEELLRFVPVQAGDAFYIPPGTVHAVGAGILLYEIQQSSDLTYRFYDWDRRDSGGNRRPLHLRQALDVVDTDSRPETAAPVPLPLQGAGVRERLIASPYFVTERFSCCEGAQLPPDPALFGVLTALSEGRVEVQGGKTILLPAGQSALLPAGGFPLLLYGGSFLLSRPAPPA